MAYNKNRIVSVLFVLVVVSAVAGAKVEGPTVMGYDYYERRALDSGFQRLLEGVSQGGLKFQWRKTSDCFSSG
jgi:hypothetical protein